jgi:hypothetical protein
MQPIAIDIATFFQSSSDKNSISHTWHKCVESVYYSHYKLCMYWQQLVLGSRVYVA